VIDVAQKMENDGQNKNIHWAMNQIRLAALDFKWHVSRSGSLDECIPDYRMLINLQD
jgi:hypothetical protein